MGQEKSIGNKPPFEMMAAGAGNILAQALEYRRREDDTHLRDLAKKYVDGKPNNYLWARSIILDIHGDFDYYLNVTLSLLCVVGGNKAYGWNYGKEISGITENFGDIDYAKKMAVVNRVQIFTLEANKILWEMNKVRVAFAHGKNITDKRYLYQGESIFSRKAIDRLVSDSEKVRKEYQDFIEKE